MKCDKCGKEFDYGNRLDGTPNGLTLVMENGAELTVCCDCVMSFSTKDGKEWLEEWKEQNA